MCMIFKDLVRRGNSYLGRGGAVAELVGWIIKDIM